MHKLRSALLYMALLTVANPVFADVSVLEALREGTMRKLVFNSEPSAVSDVPFGDPDGGQHRLSDWQGKYLLVNFWAIWCAPCKVEMPALNDLQEEFGGDDFEVVTIAAGPNSLKGIRKFFEEAEIEHLPVLLDPRQALARDSAVLGLPVTLLVDPEGREIARMRGDADWHSDSARAIVAALISKEH